MTSQTNTLFKGSLITLTVMILGMVVIGGLTRLTGSGLSIVEWKPITGFLPPLTLSDWSFEFAKYQQSPEFQKINFGITLGEFQSIFWLEYIHRLWGRLLGVVLLIPTCLMIFKKKHRELWPFFTLLWILGASQGLMGWLMVKSGLIHDPHVSPYRLAVHLMLGLAIFGVALWTTLLFYIKPFSSLLFPDPLDKKSHDFSSPGMTPNRKKENCHPWKEMLCFLLENISISCPRIFQKGNNHVLLKKFQDVWIATAPTGPRNDDLNRHCDRELAKREAIQKKGIFISEGYSSPRFLKHLTFLALSLVLLTAFFGALVAGFKAGLIYNTFPLMGENLIPREFLTQFPWWKDCLENPVSLQFLHRILASCTLLTCVGLWFLQRHLSVPRLLTYAYTSVIIAALLQFSLGIFTLLFQVPVSLATLHQGFAFILFGTLLYSFFLLYTQQEYGKKV